MKNIGRLDATLRITGSVVLLVAALALHQRPFLAIAVGLASLLLLGTAVTRFCPLYTVFHITTVRTRGV